MSTRTVGGLTVEDLGKPIALVEDGGVTWNLTRSLGILSTVEHHADATGRWSSLVTVAGGAPQRSLHKASVRVVIGGAS